MKRTFLLLLCFTSFISAQSIPTKSVMELKNSAKEIKPADNLPLLTADQTAEKKSAFLAVVYSVLLPGMGELYAGNYDRGKYFTIAEGLCWGAFAGFRIYGGWQKDNYKSFAATYGKVDLDEKSAEYFANISDYINIDEYNRTKGLERDFNNLYNTKKDYWKWSGTGQMTEYRNMWESSEQAYNNVRFAVGALIINRIISAIDAALLVRSYNKNLSEQTTWNFSFGTSRVFPSGLELNFIKSF
jgi:TM2 domain-containing membrane protein YozV